MSIKVPVTVECHEMEVEVDISAEDIYRAIRTELEDNQVRTVLPFLSDVFKILKGIPVDAIRQMTTEQRKIAVDYFKKAIRKFEDFEDKFKPNN